MSSLTLDGSNRIVGTEFVKIEITGSSNLATEQFVNEAVAGGGGNVDLTNYYNKTEVDGFLDAKLSLSGEASQTIAGSVNITNNLTTATNIQCNNIVSSNAYSNTFYNKDSNVNTTFAYDATPWMIYNNTSSKIELKPTVECENNIYTNELSNLSLDTDLIIKQDGVAYVQLEKGKDEVRAYKKIRCPEIITNGFNTGINFDDVVFKHNDITYLSFDYDTDTIVFSKPTNLVLGGGVDDELVVGTSLSIAGSQTGTNVLSVNGTSYFMDDITVPRDKKINMYEGHIYTHFDGAPMLDLVSSVGNGQVRIVIDNELHFSATRNLMYMWKPMDCYSLIKTDALHSHSNVALNFYRNNVLHMTFNTSEQVELQRLTLCKSSLIVENPNQLQTNIINTNVDGDLNIQRSSVNYINLSNTNDRVELFKYMAIEVDGTQMILSNPCSGNYTVHSLGNHISAFASGGLPSVLHLNYYSGGDVFLGHDGGAPTITVNKWSSNTGKSFEVAGVSEFSGGEIIAGGGLNTNTIDSDGDNDLIIKRNNVEFIKLEKTLGSVEMTAGAKSNTYDSIGNA